MTTLLLRLAGPMQSWGTSSRFAYRFTGATPSKSAVIGLLAAAEGRRRTDSIEDLLELRFGVRCDQPGSVIRDFQTARALDESYSLPLTYRFYLSDATFVVGIEGRRELIESLEAALRHPAYPLFLGRRSCPPSRPLVIGSCEVPLLAALETQAWEASLWYQRKHGAEVTVELVLDAEPGALADDTVQDAPLSFDPHHRRYGVRGVQHLTCVLPNPNSNSGLRGGIVPPPEEAVSSRAGKSPRRRDRATTTHDPMSWWQAR